MDKDDKRIIAEVPDKLHREVKSKATREGKTIKDVVIGLLKAWLGGEAEPKENDE